MMELSYRRHRFPPVVIRLGEAAAFDAGTARMLGWHQPEIGHQLARIGKAREVAQFGESAAVSPTMFERPRNDGGIAVHATRAPQRNRWFPDSPLEGAVHCELVSETRTQIRC